MRELTSIFATRLIAIFVLLTVGPAVAADSIKILDGDEFNAFDVRIEQPVADRGFPPPALDGWQIRPLGSVPERSLLSVEISLDDSGDQVLLQEPDQFYLESGIGALDRSLAAQTSFLGAPRMMGASGFNAGALLDRAHAASFNPVAVTLLNSTATPFTPRYAELRIGFAEGGDRDLFGLSKGLDVALTSAILTGESKLLGQGSALDAIGLFGDGRTYNVGLNVGYDGFTFAAAWLRDDRTQAQSLSGFDLGLSYSWSDWNTSIAFSNYFGDEDSVLRSAFDLDRVYAVEVGASYMIRPGLVLSGRLQMMDYQTLVQTELDGLAGALYLGGSLGF